MQSRGFTYVLSTLLLGFAAFVTWRINLPSPVAPPIVEWTDSDYQHGEYCPGDVVSNTVSIDIDSPATLVVSATFLRSGAMGDTVRPQLLGDAAVVIIPSGRSITDSDIVWQVPDLPPGNYVRAISAGTLFRETTPVFRQQTFTVREGCD